MSRVALRGGPPVHPYVFNKRIHHVDRSVRDGDVVTLTTREGRPCGFGFYHGRSLIAVRVLSYDPDRPPDEAWLRERIREAEGLRRDVLRLPEETNAWRVVNAEGDGLTGLVVDRYADVGVAALYSLGWQRRAGELERALRDEAGLEQVVLRADDTTRDREGIDLPPPPRIGAVRAEENGLAFLVDPAGGHKTGFFLDQREHRARLARQVRGKTVFDGMTYFGGFALAAARGGAASVRGMDLDEDAVARARQNARANGLEATFEHGDVFDALRAYVAGPPDERPEVLVVDPPKWIRDRSGHAAGLARYGDLNRLALQAVRPGGLVVTCSCSGLLGEEAFLGMVRGASMDVRREIRFLHVGGAAPDHPVSGVFPEGRYLKVAFLQVGPDGAGPGRSTSSSGTGAADRPERSDGPRRPRRGGGRRRA